MKLTKRFSDAFLEAARLHAKQIRKGSDVPYLTHLLGVTAIALEYGASEDEAIAALLHDAVEDAGGRPTLESLRDQFGDSVAHIVEQCSDAFEQPKPPWRQRKEAYLAHLTDATPSTRLVSASDKLHNLRSILKDYRVLGEELWQRFRGGRDGTLWYYAALVDEFSEGGPHELGRELKRTLDELKRLVEDS